LTTGCPSGTLGQLILGVIESWCQKDLAKQSPSAYSLWLENFMHKIEHLKIEVEEAEQKFQ